ncbi:MAG: hypothetical protein F4039_04670 [Gammaproteobacteria bacterium]|nr:hypothetical protein [Gammaproteobacteria bacterium]MYK43365.1 hypothetical protein [Gammaproteobacteria bacterium]
MKLVRNLTFTLTLILFSIIAYAEPPIEVIYWKSSDVQASSQEDTDSLRRLMVAVQSFFASEMDRYGYGQKTFDFNKDITVVEGKKKLNEYTDVWTIQNEYSTIKRGLDNAIYVVFMGGATSFGTGGIAVSQQLCANIPEQLKFCNNLIVVPADNKRLREVLTAHEIGHAFSLDHPTDRLVKNKVDVMFFPLWVTPGKTEYLKDYALNSTHAKFLDEEGRLFIQDGTQEANKNMYMDVVDLVAYYPFDKNVEDVSENNNHGRIVGETNYVEGKFGYAVALNNGEFVEVNASDSLHGDFFKSDPFTLALWVYPKAGTSYGHVWRSLPNGGGANTLFIIEDSGIVSWRGRIDGEWSWGNLCETDPGVFEGDTWVHVAVTNDGEKLRIYVNGEKSAETDFQETDGGSTVYRIGSPHTSLENFIGSIDDYAILSRALNEDEINEIIETGLAMFLQTEQPEPIEDSYLPEDVNLDGSVDLEDVRLVRGAIQNTTTYDTDVNDDGVTDKDDLAIVKLKAIEAILAASPRKGKTKILNWASLKGRN